MQRRDLRRIFGAAAMAAMGTGALAEGLASAYLQARTAAYRGDYAMAATAYAEALRHDPGNRMLLEATMSVQLNAGRPERAALTAAHFAEAGGDSQIADMILLVDAAQKGDWAGILARLEAGGSVGPLVDGLAAGWAHFGRGDVGAALAAFDRTAARPGLARFGRLHRAYALAAAGRHAEAEIAFSGEGSEAGPLRLTRRSAVARIENLSRAGNGSGALALLDRLFGKDLDPRLARMRAVLTDGGTLAFETVADAREGMGESLFTVASALSGEAADGYTLLYARAAEHLAPDHTDALMLSARLLMRLERHDLAIRAYGRVAADDPAHPAATIGRARGLLAAGNARASVEVMDALAERYGAMPRVQVALGDARRAVGDWGGAADAYAAALTLHGGRDEAPWRTLYASGVAHHRAGNWGAARADLRAALAQRPEEANILNYLGYSMVEAGEALPEALAMIERAAAAEPEDGFIADSLGWALFKLGRAEEAIPHLERAAALEAGDATINDHLGDVLWAVGRTREARFQWARALTLGAEDPVRIERKLAVGLDEVMAEEARIEQARLSD
ncbi:tetratricopeptide repeat protein [Hasllibacter halocynthiae]|uniref:Tetratricopeptide repeat protein n=1 Tax=Hasllibacter halocynthiae TaxID=595589 RepID=A0A2T0X3U7_9RHOB|nr:tetratricopeptide repeat protein [Hasllibacter halocynthiae]PRY93626.1 tetratricopeptide repeat protein [Hasllibacter halocynthiae]